MKQLVDQIKEQIALFTSNADLQIEEQQGSRNPCSQSCFRAFQTAERVPESVC